MQEKDGQFSSSLEGKEMLIYEHKGDTMRHVGTINIESAKATFVEPGYEEIVSARIRPLMSIRNSLGIR